MDTFAEPLRVSRLRKFQVAFAGCSLFTNKQALLLAECLPDSLESLDLELQQSGVGVGGTRALFGVPARLPRLVSLRLHGAQHGAAAAPALAEALRARSPVVCAGATAESSSASAASPSTGWRKLWSGRSKSGRSSASSMRSDDDLVAEQLAEAPASGLKCLDTRRSGISGSAAQELASAVLGCTSIEVFCEVPIKELRADEATDIDLSRQDLGPAPALVLSKLVRNCASLNSLNLEYKCAPLAHPPSRLTAASNAPRRALPQHHRRRGEGQVARARRRAPGIQTQALSPFRVSLRRVWTPLSTTVVTVLRVRLQNIMLQNKSGVSSSFFTIHRALRSAAGRSGLGLGGSGRRAASASYCVRLYIWDFGLSPR